MNFSLTRIAPSLLALALWFTVLGVLAGILPVAPNGKVPTLAPLVERVTPAVVNIAVMSHSPEQDNPMFRDPFFRRFFGLPKASRPQMSAGWWYANCDSYSPCASGASTRHAGYR